MKKKMQKLVTTLQFKTIIRSLMKENEKKKKEAKEMIAQCHKQTESIGNEKSG